MFFKLDHELKAAFDYDVKLGSTYLDSDDGETLELRIEIFKNLSFAQFNKLESILKHWKDENIKDKMVSVRVYRVNTLSEMLRRDLVLVDEI